MSPIRILFIASYFPKPDNPLMGTWALRLAEALERRDDVELLTVSFTSWVPRILAHSKGAKAYAACPAEHVWPGGVRVLYPRWLYYPVGPLRRWAHKWPAPFMHLAAWSAGDELSRICEEFKPDAIYCHHSLPNGWLARKEAQTRDIPLIIHEHDFGEIEDCVHLPARGRAFAQVTHSASTVIASSRRMEQAMHHAAPVAQKTKILYYGVHLPPPGLHQNPRPAEISGKQIILAVALFQERKGVPLLVEAFAKVSLTYPNAILRIIGSGPDEPRIRDTIARLNMSHRIQMTGPKLPTEIMQEMAWADCFALFGWDEPFGVVYLEALSVGTPILYCTDCGICEVVRHGEHGLAVPPRDMPAAADALASMLDHPQTARQMGENGRQLVRESLTWDAITGQLVKYFI